MIQAPLSAEGLRQTACSVRLCGGYDKNYCYIVACSQTKELALVDCSAPFEQIQQALEGKFAEYKLSKIFLTHAHADHVMSLKQVHAKHSPQIYAHECEYERVNNLCQVKITDFIQERQVLNIGLEQLLAIHTPGHQPGCFCFLWRDKIFTGDTLFIDGCGRCNFPESDINHQLNSLKLLANEINESTEILPGHAYGSVSESTIGREKQHNKFMIGLDKLFNTAQIDTDWIELRR
jgi:hydroxyacylglutathione hydrolase